MNKQDYINAVEVLENIINKSNSASIMDSSASRKYLESREYEALKAISDLKLALNPDPDQIAEEVIEANNDRFASYESDGEMR